MSQTSLRVLLIGPMTEGRIGGDAVKFTDLVTRLGRRGHVDVKVLSTSRPASSGALRHLVKGASTIARLIVEMASTDLVSFHASDRGLMLMGPVVLPLCKVFRKPVIVRVFGGSLGGCYERQPRVVQFLLRLTLLRADAFLCQTQQLTREMTAAGTQHVLQFPNYTETDGTVRAKVGPARKFVFLGQVRAEKGIDTLLAAASRLLPAISVDLYGPLMGMSEADIKARGEGKVAYRGVLSACETDEALRSHDALVLPTRHFGEGHPGVILEAFSRALPVVATHWRTIPEIVDGTCGVLVSPEDPTALADAMNALASDAGLFMRLSAGAIQRVRPYDAELWTAWFEKLCLQLCNSHVGKAVDVGPGSTTSRP